MNHCAVVLSAAIFISFVARVSADEPVNIAGMLAWTAQPTFLSNPAALYAGNADGGYPSFEVYQPGRGMKWSTMLPQPSDLAKTPWVVIRYRAIDAAPPPDYFVYLGGNGHEQNIAAPADLVSDGAWHTFVARVNPFTATWAAVQLQAAGPKARFELQRLEFRSDLPKLAPEEAFAVGEPGKGKFQPVDIDAICNASADQLVSALSITGWPGQRGLTVQGVPFAVGSGARAVVATKANEPSEIRISLNGLSGTEVFFLAAATSPGGGRIGQVAEPHQFSALITYGNGMADECVPARLPSGFGMVDGPAVYAVTVDPELKPAELLIRENVKGVVLSVIGVTLGLDTALAPHARPEKVGGAKPYAPVCAGSSSWRPSAVEAGGPSVSIGPIRIVFEPGISVQLSPSDTADRITLGGSLWRVKTGGRELQSTDFEGSWKQTGEFSGAVEFADRRGLGITGRLVVSLPDANRVEMSLEAESRDTRKMQIFFPSIPDIRHAGGADLGYCFPRRGAVVNDIPIDLREPYSGSMPLQFMDAYGPGGGMYLLTKDLENTYRYFLLSKDAGAVSMGVEYPEQDVGPGQPFASVPTEIGLHKGDWHAALDIYTDWVRTWYKPDAPRKDWFRRVFNFRQQFLRFYIPGGERYYDKQSKKYSFADGLKADIEAFGGVDYLHLFDWGASEKYGRTGDYEPWDEIGGLDAFAKAVKDAQAAGTPVGLYIEGYLVEPQSRIAKSHGKEWEIIGADGKPLSFFAPAMNMCSAVPEWQEYLASVYARVKKQTGAVGYYCDQMGFADPGHLCYATNHGHGTPEPPLRGQRDLLRGIRKALGPECALYTEETPVDANTRHQDGSFTYTISSVVDTWSPSHVNLTRFALPDFKTFEIIVCDHPLGDRLTAVRRIFFNGEGIWLEGPADKWFAPEVREFIAKMHGMMRTYEDCFLSLSPIPLVPTGREMVFANCFPGANRTLWTLFNANYSCVRGELLAVEHTPGVRYYDAWRGRELKPRVENGVAYLDLEIGPRDVGCVVKEVESGEWRVESRGHY